ncbi:MAG: hypothetical protein AB7K24_34290 [Gemmataceae bacterium]
MADHDLGARRATFLGYLLASVSGLIIFAGSVLVCGGMAFAFVGIVVAMGLFALVHYLLWGQALDRAVEGERVAEEFRRLVEEQDEKGPGEVFGHGRF